jgi:hypothetical protein
MLALRGDTLVDGADVIIIAFLVVDAAVLLVHVNAVSILTEDVLALLVSAVIRGLAAVKLFTVRAGSLVLTCWNIADIQGADVAVVAHAAVGAALIDQLAVALAVCVADIQGAGVGISAVLIGQATPGDRCIVTEFV